MPAYLCAAACLPQTLIASIARHVRRHATLLAFAAATLLVAPALTASAQDMHRAVFEATMQAPVPGSTYKVQDGDSLYSIAAEIGIADSKLAAWVEEFLELNDLEDADKLQAGQTVKIPGTRPAASTSSSTPGSSQTSSSSAGGSRAYTVQDGDTLYSIGANLNVPNEKLYSWVQDTMALNGWDDGDLLTTGKTIQISTKNIPVPKPITAAYTVKSGDTLHAIADKQGVSGAGLASWTSLVLELNGLSSPDMLAEGQILQLPVTTGSGNTSNATTSSSTSSSSSNSGPPSTSQNVSLTRPASTVSYTVKAGDTLEAIGMAQKVADTQLRQWIEDVRKLNKLNEDAFITEGQKLELPALSVAPPPSSTSDTSQSNSTSSPPLPPPAPSTNSSRSNTVTVTTPPASTTSNSTTTTPPPASTTNSSTTTSPALQNAPRSMTGCFYVIKAEDDLPGIARKVGVATTGVDAWIAQVKQLNGVDFKVMPVGTAIQMPC
jgi:LysM repeat protein